MNGHTLDPGAGKLDLPGMEAGSDLEAQGAHAVADRLGAPDRARRAVEGCEEPVAGDADLAPPVLTQSASDDVVVVREQFLPPPVAELDRALRGADDVGEEDGREDAVQLATRRSPVRNSSTSSTNRRWSPEKG